MAADFPSSRIAGGPQGDMMEMPGQLPQPSCTRTWTFQGQPWGQNVVRSVGRPAPFIPQSQPTGGKPAGAWLCSHCCLQAALFLSSNPTAPGEISQQNWKCRGPVGWAGTGVGWAVAVNSPLCLPQAPILACPKYFAPDCASAPHLTNSSNSFPHPYTRPKTAWPGCRAWLSEVGKYPPASALQRADNDMLTCLFVPLPHSVEM